VNIETREIKNADELTEVERASAKWIPIAKKYVKKQPISDADHARILAAHERRMRRAGKRLGVEPRSASHPAVPQEMP
jgi:hypothetical protein